jgi:hypothetical protein
VGPVKAVTKVEVLLAGLLSPVDDDTVAVFEIELTPPNGLRTVSVIVAEPEGASVPTLQLIVVVPEHVAPDTETKVKLAGRTSVMVTPVAVAGPLFVTVIV